MRKIILLFIALSFLFYPVYAAKCDPAVVCSKIYDDYNSLQEKYGKLKEEYYTLNNSYNELSKRYFLLNKSYFELLDELKEINKSLINMTNERDLYRGLYENSSLGKISIRDFYLNIEKIINNYNTTIQKFKKEVNKKFTQVNYYISILVVVFILEIALFRLKLFDLIIRIKGINFVYKKSKKIINTIRKSQKFIKIKNFFLVYEEKENTRPK